MADEPHDDGEGSRASRTEMVLASVTVVALLMLWLWGIGALW